MLAAAEPGCDSATRAGESIFVQGPGSVAKCATFWDTASADSAAVATALVALIDP